MADEPRKVATLLDARAESLGTEALAAANLDGRFALELRSVETVVSVGRIDCEVEGRLSGSSVVIETTRAAKGPARIRLNFNDIPTFAVFPGQMVGVAGINPTGALFELEQLCMPPPLSRRPRLRPIESPVTAMVAFGPYTTSHSLDYLGLQDLCRVVEEQRPSLLVLVGPFVDEQHSAYRFDTADPTVGLGTSPDPHAVMEERVAPLLQRAAASTRVAIVPSQRDVCVDPVFPQPPPTTLLDADTRARVQLLPNPAIFEAGGVQFAISGADILKGLAGEELSRRGANDRPADRLPNLCTHLLRQRSLYPLFPAQRGTTICQTQAAAFALTEAPDVLVVGSDLSPFAASVEGVACVNPGKLVRGSGAGGSYTKIAVSAGEEESAIGRPRVSVDVVKI
jgi:DNA polymerase alpha subunit B